MSRYLPLPFLLLPLLATGCQTTVGNYFANRGRDLGECFLVQAGFGPGLGVDVKAAGLAHITVTSGGFWTGASLGSVYGDLRPVGGGIHSVEGGWGFPMAPFLGYGHVSGSPFHACYGFLPSVLSWAEVGEDYDLVWVWGREANGTETRWARTHLFDIEAGVFALIVGARAGFSPGEFLDFLLGWVGIDIAGDDQPIVGSEEEPVRPRSPRPSRESLDLEEEPPRPPRFTPPRKPETDKDKPLGVPQSSEDP